MVVSNPGGGDSTEILARASGHARDIDLPDVVDLVALHGEPFESVADPDRRVPRRIATEMRDDAICEHAPSEHLGPVTLVLFDLELPRLAAHGVLRRDNLHGAAGQHAFDGLKYASRDLPCIETRTFVEPHH